MTFGFLEKTNFSSRGKLHDSSKQIQKATVLALDIRMKATLPVETNLVLSQISSQIKIDPFAEPHLCPMSIKAAFGDCSDGASILWISDTEEEDLCLILV